LAAVKLPHLKKSRGGSEAKIAVSAAKMVQRQT
jgi:hypothetical protein